MRRRQWTNDASEVGAPEPKKTKRARKKSNLGSNDAPATRKRVIIVDGDAATVSKKRKTLKKMDSKTYTTETVMVEFDAESEYGVVSEI